MRMTARNSRAREAEQGFVLVGLIVAIFIMLLVLGIAAPRVVKALRREQEVEAIHRGNQYVRAVQLYYRKNGSYPGSIAQLEKTNNVRYLRQRYVDPMTGKPDWKLIHVGEAKTTVKGFFGQPLSGLPGAGLGNAAGMSSSGSVGAGTAGVTGSSFGSSSFGTGGNVGSSGSSFGSSSFGSPSASSTGATAPAGTGAGTGTTGSASGTGASTTDSTGLNSQSATSMGTGAPIMGVGSAATGSSIVVLNEQTSYPKWEFIYDPRIELLKAKASLLGGAPSSVNASSLGSSTTSPGIGVTPPGSNGIGSPGTTGLSNFGASGTGTTGGGMGTNGATPLPSPQ
jgi:type II secretory pathway pseudopilin PulG